VQFVVRTSVLSYRKGVLPLCSLAPYLAQSSGNLLNPMSALADIGLS
jgi:hypothetical protein